MASSSPLFADVCQEVQTMLADATGGGVLLACSGGADSMFLARACQDLSANVYARVVDHGLNEHSAQDAKAAVVLLQELGFDAAVLQDPASAGLNESDWRGFRYRLLTAEAKKLGLGLVLTAHTADDSAETILMRLMRGTGLRGLTGIPFKRSLDRGIEVFRPMLHLRSREVRESLRAVGQSWLEDPSNADSSIAARNYLRHEVMPGLHYLATGDPVTAVNRLAEEASDWQECLAELLPQAMQNWKVQPSYLRRQAIAVALRDLKETISPTRLLDLEGSLLRKGSAAINESHRLSLSGGGLSVRER